MNLPPAAHDPAVANGEDEAAERQARLQRLMERIARSADFASVRDSILGIQKAARSETSHTRALAGQISDDVAMTSKLLRLINAAFYASAGGGQITNMQRAVALMGFQTVGMLASSLVLFERLPSGADGEGLRREFARSQLAGLLAQGLAQGGKALESAFLGAQFQGLGDMLAGMHFAADRAAIDAELHRRALSPGAPEWLATRERLARQRWGLSIQEIGIEVARQWGWPESLLGAMRSLWPEDRQRAVSPQDYSRVLCTACNHLAGELMGLPATGSDEDRAAQRRGVVDRFGQQMAVPLSLQPARLHEEVEDAQSQWESLVKALGIDLRRAPAAPRATAAATPAEARKPAAKAGTAAASAAPAASQSSDASEVSEALSAALETVSLLALSGAPAAQVLQQCVQHIHQALALQRVIVCLRDAPSGRLKGRIGLGERAPQLAGAFDIALQPPGCLFGLLTAKNADTLISDTADPIIAQRLPAWYRQQVAAPTFLLLPLVAGPQVLGLIYGDRAEAGSLRVGERELTLLKTLRNQVVLAMRMGGG